MSLPSLDKTRDFSHALRPGARKSSSNLFLLNGNQYQIAGWLSLQQIPYECPDPSFEFFSESDVLKPVVGTLMILTLEKEDELTKIVKPYKPPSKAPSKNKEPHSQDVRPIPVPSLDDVRPFMSAPEFVEKPGSGLDALLRSRHVQNPYPYPETTNLLPSYETEIPESIDSNHLRKHANHALAHCWRYDPFCCSVKDAFKFDQDLFKKPSHGLSEGESQWATAGKFTIVQKARNAAQVDSLQARKSYKWMKNLDEKEETLNIDSNSIGREVDDFYGPDGTDLRPIDNDPDEGYCGPDDITTTIVSLPEKSLLEEGVTPGGIFQDSGISMDAGYAKYSRAHTLHTLAKERVATPSDSPAFSANVRPFRTRKPAGHWLKLIGDQRQRDWPGRRQGPYDLEGLHLQENVDSRPSEPTSQSSDQKQSFVARGNTEDRIAKVHLGNSEVSVGALHPVSEERPTSFLGSAEKGSDNGESVPASPVMQKVPQVDDDTCGSMPNTAFNTPVNQRINQILQVQLKTPATPATVDINLTPERDNDMVVDNVSDGSEFGEDPLVLPLDHSSQPNVRRRSRKYIEVQRNKSYEMLTLSPSKPSQDTSPSPKKASIPVTPAYATDTAVFRPVTPFQLGTSAHEAVFDSPGTPTPAPRGRQTKEKSVTNIFNSPQLGNRSPERARPDSAIFAVTPTPPMAGATDPPHGRQGLLFQKKKKNERGTMNVLNSLRLPSPEREIAGAEGAVLDDFEDELTTASGGEVFKGGRSALVTRSGARARAGNTVAQAVMVPRDRARDENEGGQADEVQPRTKRARLSIRA